MAYNFLGLVNEVNRRLNEVELTEANFATAVGFYATTKDAVNSAIRHINHEEFGWPFNHVEQEDTLTPGTVRYAMPSNSKFIDQNTFRIKRDEDLNVDTRYLTKRQYYEYLNDGDIDFEYNTGNTNIRTIPEYIVIAPSREYIVYPAPDKAYSLIYEYYRNPVDLELFDDVPTIPEEFKHIIVDGAMYNVYQFRGDNQSAQISQAKFMEGIKYLRTLYINNNYNSVRSTSVFTRRRLAPVTGTF